jgi:membrane protease YdiL (CAAX protease family)
VGSAVAAVAVPHSRAALILLSLAGLWTGLLGAVWTASRRFGTGDVRRDFGARLAGGDLGRGVVVALVGRVAGVVLVLPIVAANRKFAGSDLKPFEGARNDPALLAIVVVLVLVGAPFVEELFFRGLLLRSLLPLLGSTGAIAVQAVLFAAMHLRPSYGPGNVSLVVAIGAMGVLQGIVAERYRRLGPVVVAHGLFNLPGLLSIAAR